MLLVKIGATSRQAKILERRHNKRDEFRWLGAEKFEAVQLIKTIDAKLCNPLPVIMIEDYTWEAEDDDVSIAAIIEEDEIEIVELPKGFDPLHIFIDEEYKFSTTQFETKKIALKHYRAQEEYKEQNLTAKINNNSFKRRKITTHLED